MKKIALFITLLSVSITLFAQEEFFSRYHRLGFDYAGGVLEADDGNYIVSGSFSGIGSGFLFIDSTNGNPIDSIFLAGLGEKTHSFIRCYDNGFLICGSSPSNITKLDENFNLEWSNSIPNNYGIIPVSGIQLKDSTYVYLSKNSLGDNLTYILKLNHDGNLIDQDSLHYEASEVTTVGDTQLAYIGTRVEDTFSIAKISLSNYNLDSMWEIEYGDSTGEDSGNSIIESIDENAIVCAVSLDNDIVDAPYFTKLLRIDFAGNVILESSDLGNITTSINKNEDFYVRSSIGSVYFPEESPFPSEAIGLSRFNDQFQLLNACGDLYVGESFIDNTNIMITSTGSTVVVGHQSQNIYTGTNYLNKTDIAVAKVNLDCQNILNVTKDKELNQLEIYPNPTTSILNIENIPNDSEITLYNISGQEVLRKRNNSNFEQLALNFLNKGLYILRITSEKGNFEFKVSKN